MKKSSNLYYSISWLVIVAVYNAVLFLVTLNSKNADIVNSINFWINYFFVMVSFVMILLIKFTKKNQYNLSSFFSTVFPVLSFIVLFGTVIFIILPKLNSIVWVIVVYIILFAVALIWFILSLLQSNNVKQYKEKTVEVIDYEGFVKALNDIKNMTDNDLVKMIIDRLIDKTKTIPYNNSAEAHDLDKRIFEYVIFLKKDLKNNEVNNCVNNSERLNKLIDQRVDMK